MTETLIQTVQIYGLVIVISMIVAVLIKVLVVVTSRPVKTPAVELPVAVTPSASAEPLALSADVVAAISAAIGVIAGPVRILHIAHANKSWSHQGRSAQHTHTPIKH